ncbi:hypothetical protein MES4922_30448 [Mesorhizobium ventifaucium]|uniref:MFS transporter n=1 Tax=Mesorhizobium ventifaucium TaxID=666020 RepID=A0ABM9DZ42_9HYPH|nr:hypothetical protein MES4922_30448 [Mesorhizobium ventifaucium]
MDGALVGILIYNTAVSILPVYAGAVLKMTGVMLWSAAGLHALLAVWSCLLLRGVPSELRRQIGDN